MKSFMSPKVDNFNPTRSSVGLKDHVIVMMRVLTAVPPTFMLFDKLRLLLQKVSDLLDAYQNERCVYSASHTFEEIFQNSAKACDVIS